MTEARAPDEWANRRIGDLRAVAGGDVEIAALIRRGERKLNPHPNTLVRAGDILLIEGDADVLHRVIADWKMEPGRAQKPLEKHEAKEEIRSIEAVVGADSPLIGRSARGTALQSQYNVKLLALHRSGRRVTHRLRTASIRAGDILVLRGPESDLPNALTGLGALPLAERAVRLGARRPLLLPAVILACAMVLVAFKFLPIAIAFMGAAVLMVLFRTISMRDAYASLDGPVLVLIGALTPVSEALQRTGGADLLAAGFSAAFGHLPDQVVLASLMLSAMICSPFLHNAPTVLILGPVAVGVAHRLGLSPDPLLMAVATGAGCDFLTPVGHQCNTMVLGPGGYRFSDYARLGAPLSLLVILVGTALIAIVWPLHGR
jgi:di/tricarboxylate transporter